MADSTWSGPRNKPFLQRAPKTLQGPASTPWSVAAPPANAPPVEMRPHEVLDSVQNLKLDSAEERGG